MNTQLHKVDPQILSTYIILYLYLLLLYHVLSNYELGPAAHPQLSLDQPSTGQWGDTKMSLYRRSGTGLTRYLKLLMNCSYWSDLLWMVWYEGNKVFSFGLWNIHAKKMIWIWIISWSSFLTICQGDGHDTPGDMFVRLLGEGAFNSAQTCECNRYIVKNLNGFWRFFVFS